MKVAQVSAGILLGALVTTAFATDLKDRSVSFSFGWEPGLGGIGETRISGSAAHAPDSTFRFNFVTDGVGDNLRVRRQLTGFSPEPSNDDDELFARMSGAVAEPDILVSTSGRFVGLDDIGVLRAALRSDVRESFERKHLTRPDTSNFDRYIAVETAPERLESRLAEDWHRLVARWIGVRARVGIAHPIDDVTILPLAGRQQPRLSLHGTYTVTRLEPCQRDRVSRVCAVIEMNFEPDAADLERVTNEIYGKAVDGKPKAGSVHGMTVAVNAVVVTEPDGLVPHRYTIAKRIEMNLSDDGKSQQRTVDQRETTFTYP